MIPPTLGAGKRVTLDRMSVPVNIATSNRNGSAVVVGPVIDSPIGAKVVLGVVAKGPDEAEARSYLAHLTPDEATHLAGKLLEAAAIIAEAEQFGRTRQ